MNLYTKLILLACSSLVAACAVKAPPDKFVIPYQTSYFDRNKDGLVDYERHAAIGWADADWYFEDTDFNGRYDRKTYLGYAVFYDKVNIQVPDNVLISPTPKHLHRNQKAEQGAGANG